MSTEDVSSLVIKVASTEVETADKRLDNMARSAGKAETATESLTGAAHQLVAEYISVRAAYEGVKIALDNVIDSTVESEGIQAKLRATTGASKAQAFEMFQALDELEGKFATPIKELTDAYTLLASRGLDPSRQALERYADLAAGTGGTITGVAESIAQASNGMFRGLNQLGVKAEQQLDGLALTFRGTTTKVKGDSASIEQYLQTLSKNTFLGAAEAQADSLGGSIFRLKDAWGDMWRAVSEQGAGGLIKEGVQLAIDGLHELTDMLASGQLTGYIDAVIHKFDSFGTAFADIVNFIKGSWHGLMEVLGLDTDSALGFITDAFLNLPENVTAVVKDIGATYGLIVEYATAVGRGSYDVLVGYFRYTLETIKGIGHLIWEVVKNPSGAGAALGEFYTNQTKAVDEFATTAGNAWNTTKANIESATDAFGEQVTAIHNERDASLNSFKEKISAADQLRLKYDQVKAAKVASGEDPLKAGQQKRGDDVGEAQRGQFDSLKAALQLQEKTIQESYVKRLTFIRNMTKEGSAERLELERKLTEQTSSAFEQASAQRLEDVLKLEDELRQATAEGNITKSDALRVQLNAEEAAMKESYDYRRQLILANTKITEEERQAMLAKLGQKYTDQGRQIEVAKNKATLNITADFFANISTIASAFGAKGARIAKAAAIINATIKTYEAATSAYAAMAGIPYIGPALGGVAAAAAITAGFLNIQAIRSQNYSGEHATGGYIPPGSFGLAGETGVPEFVQGPAVVTSANESARRLRNQSGGGESSVIINITNSAPGVSVEQTGSRRRDDGVMIVDMAVKAAVAEVANQIETGQGTINSALTRRTNVKRVGN